MEKLTLCKAVIFDLDGVLVTTDDYHYQAWKRIADEEDIPFDRKTNERLRGVSRMESLSIILEHAKRRYSEAERLSLAERKNTYYKTSLATLSAADILPGVVFLLKELKKRGIKVAVGSSSKNARCILERTSLVHYFDAIVDGNDIRRSKPDPEVFATAAIRLGVSPAECVVVEDAVAGVEAAYAAGMRCVAVGSAAESPKSGWNAPNLANIDAEKLIAPIDRAKHANGGTNMIDLKANPFYLNDDDIQWVQTTLAGLTEDEKIAQLFCMIATEAEEGPLGELLRKVPFGGIMYRPTTAAKAVAATRFLQTASKVPVLIAANLEKGGTGIVQEGTVIGSNLLVAATDEEAMAAKLGTACGREGNAVGANWAFAPVVDIDYNFRNPITNTRTYGSNPERVKRMGVAYTTAVQAEGVAASIKHFPGDGVDERDQHLVTSINDLPCEAWDATYGSVYKACIDAGALTVMAGHIAQPNWSRRLDPTLRDQDILPATLAPELLNGLLRGRLGFNGLIVTDASTMAGMTIPLPRERAVPKAIAAGCDMFLFTRNIDEDLAFMKSGLSDGTISGRRLNEAVTRILALKAALKLHIKKIDGSLFPTLEGARRVLGCAEHKAWAKEAADRAATLVKNEPGVLPISPQKYPKILYYEVEAQQGYAYSVRAGVAQAFKELLEKEGFAIDVFEPGKAHEGRVRPTADITENYDLIVYLANMSTKSNQTAVRIEWAQPMGANVPVFMTKVPTIFVSVENPYHLLDVPRVRTFVNGYCATDEMLRAIVDKLCGRSEFSGINPVDPFCGRWDTRLS